MNLEFEGVLYKKNVNTADVIKLVKTLGVKIERFYVSIAHCLLCQ